MGEAKRNAKLNSSAMNSSRHDHFGDFVHAVRDGRAGKLIRRNGMRASIEAMTHDEIAGFDFIAPSYNFGNICNVSNVPAIIEAGKQANVLMESGDLHLPHEHCFFLFQIASPHGADVVVEAREEAGRIDFFMWHYTPHGRWLWENACSTYRHETKSFYFVSDCESDYNPSDLFRNTIEICLWSMVALATKPEDQIIETTELCVQATNQRTNRQGIAYPTRLIRLRTTAAERLKTLTVRPVSPIAMKESVGRCPHDRRGHERFYKKTGKRIWINETKIKGGSPVPRPTVVQVMH